MKKHQWRQTDDRAGSGAGAAHPSFAAPAAAAAPDRHAAAAVKWNPDAAETIVRPVDVAAQETYDGRWAVD